MIVADTQIVIWTALEPARLSIKAREIIQTEQKQSGLAVSDKTLWEVAMAVRRGRVVLSTTLREFLQAIEEKFQVLPVTSAIAEQSVSFSNKYPHDPADRIIGATAVVHGIRLVTSDALIRASGEVRCIW